MTEMSFEANMGTEHEFRTPETNLARVLGSGSVQFKGSPGLEISLHIYPHPPKAYRMKLWKIKKMVLTHYNA